MNPDIVFLEKFYLTSFGSLTRRSIRDALFSVWTPASKERFAALGYPIPWIKDFSKNKECTLLLMPGSQGAVVLPSCDYVSVALVEEDRLPLSSSSLDRIFLIHILEYVSDPEKVLAELFRVLSPGGRLVLAVPNFYSLWSKTETTPFGLGKSFSKNTLENLLLKANFKPCRWSGALFFLPFSYKKFDHIHIVMEDFFSRFPLFFSGVLIVEAQKQIYGRIPLLQVSSRSYTNLFPGLKPRHLQKKVLL